MKIGSLARGRERPRGRLVKSCPTSSIFLKRKLQNATKRVPGYWILISVSE